MTFIRILLAAVFLAAIATSPVAGQEYGPRSHMSLNTGLFQFDLAGSGLAPMIAIRGARAVSQVVLFEVALLAARPGQDFATTTYVVPEAQLQLVLPFDGISPYLGLGTGVAIDVRDSSAGGLNANVTISGSIGVKAWLGDEVGIQGEFRGRGVELDFDGSSSEYTLGLIWAL